MEKLTANPIAEILPKTLATLAPTEIRQTTAPLWPGKKERRWLDKWLKLTDHPSTPIPPLHPQLQSMELALWNFCKDYAKQPSDGRRLLIHGGNGCGKTHAAKAIYNWAKRTAMLLPLTSVPNGTDEDTQLATVQFMFWPSIVDRFKPPHNDYEIIDRALEQSLVIIDDIGAEHDPSGIGKEKLFYMLERRAKRWTVMTTNVPPCEWETKFERRIASRFLRNCEAVNLSNVPDFCAL